MAKIGRLTKLPGGRYRLQYKARRVLAYQVDETKPRFEFFRDKKEALKFIEENNIKLEKGGK